MSEEKSEVRTFEGMNPGILSPRMLEAGELPEEIKDMIGNNNREGISISAVLTLDAGGHRHVIRRRDAGFSDVGPDVA